MLATTQHHSRLVTHQLLINKFVGKLIKVTHKNNLGKDRGMEGICTEVHYDPCLSDSWAFKVVIWNYYYFSIPTEKIFESFIECGCRSLEIIDNNPYPISEGNLVFRPIKAEVVEDIKINHRAECYNFFFIELMLHSLSHNNPGFALKRVADNCNTILPGWQKEKDYIAIYELKMK